MSSVMTLPDNGRKKVMMKWELLRLKGNGMVGQSTGFWGL